MLWCKQYKTTTAASPTNYTFIYTYICMCMSNNKLLHIIKISFTTCYIISPTLCSIIDFIWLTALPHNYQFINKERKKKTKTTEEHTRELTPCFTVSYIRMRYMGHNFHYNYLLFLLFGSFFCCCFLL